MMETEIYNFHTSFYITEIHKLAFHIPHAQILGTNQCSESLQTAFKRRKQFQDVLCHRDYADRLASSFTHKIQSEYYGGNILGSIEGITLENLST